MVPASRSLQCNGRNRQVNKQLQMCVVSSVRRGVRVMWTITRANQKSILKGHRLLDKSDKIKYEEFR